ncbi:MAG: hypothetical protein HQK60_08930 [Deltaproteobacteria bacterium]|nr:hypothetical protein [Deltaproteobacteria bacterium]
MSEQLNSSNEQLDKVNKPQDTPDKESQAKRQQVRDKYEDNQLIDTKYTNEKNVFAIGNMIEDKNTPADALHFFAKGLLDGSLVQKIKAADPGIVSINTEMWAKDIRSHPNASPDTRKILENFKAAPPDEKEIAMDKAEAAAYRKKEQEYKEWTGEKGTGDKELDALQEQLKKAKQLKKSIDDLNKMMSGK